MSPMLQTLLNWQRGRRRREHHDPMPAIDREDPFWGPFLDGTTALANFDVSRALELLSRADLCCPPDDRTRAAVEETLGELRFELNDYGGALAHFRRAQHLWTELWEPLFDAEARAWLGACWVRRGEYQQAFDALQSALDSFDNLGRKERGARALNYFAVLYEELGDFSRAFEFYQRAHQAATDDRDADMQGRVLANCGEAHLTCGEVERATEVLTDAVDVLRQLGDHRLFGWCLMLLGRIAFSRGDEVRAFEYVSHALYSVERSHSPRARVEVYAGLGELQSKRGFHVEAQEWLLKALQVASAIGLRREVFKTHKLLAEAAKRAGQFEVALSHFELFHEVRSEVFDQLARERMATLKAEFELQRMQQGRERERLRNRALSAAYDKLEERARTLNHLSQHDPLTGLLNRRHFDETLSLELARSQSFNQPLSLVMVDVDRFKRINDGFSHVTGDAVLKAISHILGRELRQSDFASRYGGEEFALILPNTSLEGARIAAEKVRVAIATSDWSQLTPGLDITASLGLAQWQGEESPLDFVRRTDVALYAAKEAGRNRVRTG
jgi:diguanylate cyclase (GGDEF)-like protein